MKTSRKGLLNCCGKLAPVTAAVLVLLWCNLLIFGRSRPAPDYTQPCIGLRNNRKLARHVQDAAAAGYRIIFDEGGMVFMARQTAPPDTYKYVMFSQESIGPSRINKINHLGAMGYRLDPVGDLRFSSNLVTFFMEKAPYPQNWHYVLELLDPVATPHKASHHGSPFQMMGLASSAPGLMSIEWPGAQYHYHSTVCCDLVRTHGVRTRKTLQVLFESRGEALKSENPSQEGVAWLAKEQALAGYRGKGYRIFQWVWIEKRFFVEKPAAKKDAYVQRFIDKSKDSAVIQAKLNDAGKVGFRLLATSLFSHTLVAQKPAAPNHTRYVYRVLPLKRWRDVHAAAVAACSEGFYPIAEDAHSGISHHALALYLEKKSGARISSRDHSVKATNGGPGPGLPRSGSVGLANETPVEIELLKNVSSESKNTSTPVPFKVIQPVRVNHATLIAAGTCVRAKAMTSASKHWGKAGLIVLAKPETTAVDGTRIPLRFARWTLPKPISTVRRASERIAIHAVGALLGAGEGGILLWPLVPFMAAAKGKRDMIPAGERFQVYVDGNFVIKLKGKP